MKSYSCSRLFDISLESLVIDKLHTVRIVLISVLEPEF